MPKNIRISKFRGKTLDNKHWIESKSILYTTALDGHLMVELWDYSKNEWRFILPESLREFTGSWDSNNQEIYEGDIIKADIWNNKSNNYRNGLISFIFYDKARAMFSVQILDSQLIQPLAECVNIKIVGNIYDNKEFLEEA